MATKKRLRPRERKKKINWKGKKHVKWIFKRGKIYLDLTTGRVFDQTGRELPADETIADEVTAFDVPDYVIDRIIEVQGEIELEYHEEEVKQAMEEARIAKLKEIRARKQAEVEEKMSTRRKSKTKKKLEEEEEFDEDEFEDDEEDDFDDELEAEFEGEEKPKAKAKRKTKKSSPKKRKSKKK